MVVCATFVTLYCPGWPDGVKRVQAQRLEAPAIAVLFRAIAIHDQVTIGIRDTLLVSVAEPFHLDVHEYIHA